MVPTFAFFCLNAGAMLTRGQKKMWKEHCNHSQWGAREGHRLEGIPPGHRDGGEGIRLLGTTRRQEGLGSLLQSQVLKRTRGTDLETGPQKWDRDCQTEAGLGLKKLGVSRGQRPLERKNLVLGVWVDGVQEGSQQFFSFKFKVYVLTLLPAASAESYDSCAGRSPLDCHKPSN